MRRPLLKPGYAWCKSCGTILPRLQMYLHARKCHKAHREKILARRDVEAAIAERKDINDGELH
jgi:hypothetical protein